MQAANAVDATAYLGPSGGCTIRGFGVRHRATHRRQRVVASVAYPKQGVDSAGSDATLASQETHLVGWSA